MEQIRIGLEHRIPVEAYAKTDYDAFQMKQIRLGLEQGLDVSIYLDHSFTGKIMLLIRLGMLEGIEVSEYAIPGISEEKADAIYHKLMDLQTSIVSNDNSGEYEIGDAYLDLLGWGTTETEMLTDNSTASVGITNPEFHLEMNDTAAVEAGEAESESEKVDTAESIAKEESVKTNESAMTKPTVSNSITEKQSTAEMPDEDLHEIKVDYSNVASQPLDLSGLDKFNKGNGRHVNAGAPGRINV